MWPACAACGFAGIPGSNPTSPDWHRAHERQHLDRFPRADVQTRNALAEMVRFAEQGKFAAPSPEAA